MRHLARLAALSCLLLLAASAPAPSEVRVAIGGWADPDGHAVRVATGATRDPVGQPPESSFGPDVDPNGLNLLSA